MSRASVQLTVHGRVQGVFFRQGCREQAESRNVAGWVRNELDGTVTGHLEGESEDVEAVLAWCRQGPPQASVARVETAPVAPEHLTGFHTR